MEEALNDCLDGMNSSTPDYFVTANLDFAQQAYHNEELRDILFFATRVFCDGMPLVWLSKLFGLGLKYRITGSDLVPELLKLCAVNNKKIYFLGSDELTIQKLIKHLAEALPCLQIVGWDCPQIKDVSTFCSEGILEKIKDAAPDLLLVAMGCPKQEMWISRHYKLTGVPLSIGIGASLDFIAGKQKRAPIWIQKVGLEWFWRFSNEPKRLFKRYWNDGIFFITMAWRQYNLQYLSRHPVQLKANSIEVSKEGFVYLRWKGDLLKETVSELQWPEDWNCPVICDLSESQAIDNAGLGRIAQLARSCRLAGVKYVFLQPSQEILLYIKSFHLESQLPFVHTAEELRQIMK